MKILPHPFCFLMLFLGTWGVSLFVFSNPLSALQKDEIKKPNSYAGLAEIRPDKNYFILVGDTQKTGYWEFWRERNDQERKLIADEISMRDPGFLIFLGDLTVYGSSEKHWQNFDDLYKEFRDKNIPCFPILGNHELYGGDMKALQNYFERFPHLEKRRWYSFTWKNIGFIMVDSNFSSLTKEQIDEQSRWYLGELEKFQDKNEIDHIIVCCHHPPFTNSRVIRPSRDVEVSFASPFLRFQKTRLFFSGHCHSYERFQKGSKVFIVSGGGGGPRHQLNTDPQKRFYDDRYGGPELRFFHFCEIEISGTCLLLKVIRLEQDGSFIIVESLKI